MDQNAIMFFLMEGHNCDTCYSVFLLIFFFKNPFNLKKFVVLEASPFGFVFYSQPHHHPLMNSMAFKSTVLVPIGSVSILLLTKIIDLGFTTI